MSRSAEFRDVHGDVARAEIRRQPAPALHVGDQDVALEPGRAGGARDAARRPATAIVCVVSSGPCGGGRWDAPGGSLAQRGELALQRPVARHAAGCRPASARPPRIGGAPRAVRTRSAAGRSSFGVISGGRAATARCGRRGRRGRRDRPARRASARPRRASAALAARAGDRPASGIVGRVEPVLVGAREAPATRRRAAGVAPASPIQRGAPARAP